MNSFQDQLHALFDLAVNTTSPTHPYATHSTAPEIQTTNDLPHHTENKIETQGPNRAQRSWSSCYIPAWRVFEVLNMSAVTFSGVVCAITAVGRAKGAGDGGGGRFMC